MIEAKGGKEEKKEDGLYPYEVDTRVGQCTVNVCRDLPSVGSSSTYIGKEQPPCDDMHALHSTYVYVAIRPLSHSHTHINPPTHYP